MKMKRILSLILVVAMVATMMSFNFASNADELYNKNASFNTLSQSDTVLFSTYNVPADNTEGITLWIRLTGVKESFNLYEMKFNVATRDHSGIWSYNHGQDGCRNAMFPINASGDYLFFIPFTYYTLSHSFVGDDYVTAISNFSIKADNVTNANKNAEIALMGIFDGKVDEFKTTLVDGDSEKEISGTYEYMKSELSSSATNYQSTEYYNTDLGKAERAVVNIDYTDTIRESWTYAYVDSVLPDSYKEGKQLLGWMDQAEGGSPMIPNGENTLYANYTDSELAAYTVTFKNDDGTVLGTDKVLAGETAVYNGKTPTKASTDTKCYEFTGWSKNVSSVTGDMEVVATYRESDITYKVTYIKAGKQIVAIEPVVKGADAIFEYDAETNGAPERNGNAEVYYEYDGSWTDAEGNKVELKGITQDMTVYMGFKEIPETETYTITFVDADGTEIDKITTGVHSYVEYTAKDPVKAADEENFYAFAGWDKEFAELREDATITATYGKTPVKTASVAGASLGVQATLNGEEIKLITTPHILTSATNTNHVTYVTVILEAEGIESPVTLGGLRMKTRARSTSGIASQVLDSNNSGEMVAKPAGATLSEDGYYYLAIGHRLVNWTGNGYGSINALSFADPASKAKPSVNDNEDLSLNFVKMIEGLPEFDVRFYDEDKNFLCTQKTTVTGAGTYAMSVGKLADPADVYVGEVPAKADDDLYKYNFAGWADAEGNLVTAITDNMDLYAFFEKEIKDPVKVGFVNGTETIISYDIPRGTVTAFEGEAPRKSSDADWSYLFQGWTTDSSKVLALTEAEVAVLDLTKTNVAEDTTFYAVYLRVERMAEVTFFAEDKTTELGKVYVKKGEVEGEIPTAPAKEATVEFTYAFDKWVDADGNKVEIEKQEEDISVYASYAATTNKYTATFYQDDKETVIAEVEVDYGTAATAPEATKDADEWYTYTFEKWIDAEGNDADFSTITGDTAIYAQYTATFQNPFDDLEMDRFYGEAVEYCLVNGIMNGASETKFNPNGDTSRAMLVTVLYRIEGEPDVSEYEAIPFTDVIAGKYYTNAVIWAYNNDVVNGISDTEYKPDNAVTREQFATILYRYADEIKGYYMSSGRATLSGFQDKSDIASWAQNAVKWAIADAEDMTGQGVSSYNKTAYITGSAGADGKTYMNPKKGTTRAQMATMLYRFVTSEQLGSDGKPLEGAE